MPAFIGALPYAHYAKVHPRRKLSSIKQLSPQLFKSIRLAFYTLIIFICGMSAAVLIQKMYKTPYINNVNPDVEDFYKNPFGIPIFVNFFGMFYGFLKYQIATQTTANHNDSQNIPTKQILKISSLDTTIIILCNLVIILSSFTTYNLINCCSLLSAVIVAVFCSRYRHLFIGYEDNEQGRMTQVKTNQLKIAFIVVIGIIMFNTFSDKSSDGVNKPLNVWTTLLIIILLILEGIRPQIAMQVRTKFRPRPSYLLYEVSKLNFLLIFSFAVLTTQFFDLIAFLWNHDRLALDLTLIAILSIFAQIFIYRVLVLHKQHVIPFILTIRKVFTSIFNIIYFHHNIKNMQILGMVVIALGITLQLINAYMEVNNKNQDGPVIQAKFQQVQQQIQEETI